MTTHGNGAKGSKKALLKLVVLGAAAFSCSLGTSLVLSATRTPKLMDRAPPTKSDLCEPLGPSTWMSPDGDAEVYAQALAKSTPSNRLLQGDYATFHVLDGWIEGYADDSPSGQMIATCRRRIEPWLTSDCYWDHDILIQRVSDTSGKVVATRTNLPRCPSSACKALIQCIDSAWRDRPAPFPLQYSETYIATNAGAQAFNPSYLRGSLAPWHGAVPAPVYEAALTQAIASYEKDIADLRAAPSPEDVGWRHDLRINEAFVTDVRTVLAVPPPLGAGAQRQ